MAGVASGHHVFSIEHLLSKLRNCKRPVLLAASRGQRREPRHEEMKAWKRDLCKKKCNMLEAILVTGSELQGQGRAANTKYMHSYHVDS